MKAKILSTLDNLNINYHIVEHPPIMTMEEGSAIAQKLNILACKNLFLVNKQREFFLLLLPAYKKLNTKNISKQIGSSHLSFASTEDMAELLYTSSGAVSILGVIFDDTNKINLLIDKEVIGMEYIGCHPCENTSSLKLKTEDVLNIFLPATNHAHYKIVE